MSTPVAPERPLVDKVQESCSRARARDPSGPPSSLHSSPARLAHIPAMGGSLPHKGLVPSSGTDEPQNCLLSRWDPLCLLKGRASAPSGRDPSPQRVHTHTCTQIACTHTHTRRFGPVKVPAACRAWPGAEIHQKGQGSQPGSLHLRLLASAGRSQAAPLLCWPDLQDPGALGRAVLWQQQNTPSRSEGCSAHSGLRVWSGDPREATGCSTPVSSPRHASTRRSFLLRGCSPVFPKPPVLMGGRDVS